MTMFDSRDHAFQTKHARDAENQFRAKIRRARLLGQWAAKMQGMTGTDASAYAKDIVWAYLGDAGGQTLSTKLTEDLAGLVDLPVIKAKISDHMKESRARPRATD